ncbi:hypothetical protein WDW37_20235 [Bdellovibrionota bacterium FG-1]
MAKSRSFLKWSLKIAVLGAIGLAGYWAFPRFESQPPNQANQTVREMAKFLETAPPSTLRQLTDPTLRKPAQTAATAPVPQEPPPPNIRDLADSYAPYLQGSPKAAFMAQWMALNKLGTDPPTGGEGLDGMDRTALMQELMKEPEVLTQDLGYALEQIPESATQERLSLLALASQIPVTEGATPEPLKAIFLNEASHLMNPALPMTEEQEIRDGDRAEFALSRYIGLETDPAKRHAILERALQSAPPYSSIHRYAETLLNPENQTR